MIGKQVLIDAEKNGGELSALLEEGGEIFLRVTGTSMLPLLHPGRSVVKLVGCRGALQRRGDILLFRRTDSSGESGSFVLHRLRRILPDGRLLMNGDAQSWCEVISPDSVIARVTEIIDGRFAMKTDGLLMRAYRLLWYPTYRFRPRLLGAATALRNKLKKG